MSLKKITAKIVVEIDFVAHKKSVLLITWDQVTNYHELNDRKLVTSTRPQCNFKLNIMSFSINDQIIYMFLWLTSLSFIISLSNNLVKNNEHKFK